MPVENLPVWEDAEVHVGGENGVEPPDLLVPEESVRHPDPPAGSMWTAMQPELTTFGRFGKQGTRNKSM